MEKKNWVWSFATAMFMACALCACDDDEEETIVPSPEPEAGGLTSLTANTFTVGDDTTAVGSAVAFPEEENIRFVAAVEEGLDAGTILYAANSYVSVVVSPDLVGKEFDIVNEKQTFSVNAVWNGGDIYVEMSPGTGTEESGVSEGTCLVTKNQDTKSVRTGQQYDGDKYELFLKLKTTDGTEFSVRAAAVLTQAEEEKGELTDLEKETITVDSESSAVGSEMAAPYSGGVYVAATPEKDLTTVDDILGTDKWVYAWVNPSLIGQEFDILNEKAGFTVQVSWGDIYIEMAPGITPEEAGLSEGKCLIQQDGDTYEMFLRLKTTDGTTISARAAAVATGEVNSNTFTYNDETDPVRAAFYTTEYGAPWVYLTPGGVDYFDEMVERAFYYACIALQDESAANGEPIDLATAWEAQVYLYDNIAGLESGGDPLMLTATSGTLTMKINGEGNYTISLDCTLDNGSHVAVEFDGECKPTDAAYEYANTFTYKDVTALIQSVYIEKNSDTQWTVYVSDTDAKSFEECKESSPVILVTPPITEETQAFGFSKYPFMYFEYQGHKWSNPDQSENGDTGTVEASLVGTTLTMKFNNYVDLSGEYQGEVKFAQ